MEVSKEEAKLLGVLFTLAKCGDLYFDLESHGVDFEAYDALQTKVVEFAASGNSNPFKDLFEKFSQIDAGETKEIRITKDKVVLIVETPSGAYREIDYEDLSK